MNIEIDLIFVYGALLSNGVNHHLLSQQGAVSFVAEGHTKGKLFLIDWYPGFVSSGDSTVKGEIYHMNDPIRTLPFLDRYEGIYPGDKDPEYRRICVDVTSGNKTFSCYTYEYIWPIHKFPEIENGDFLSALNSNN